MNSFFEKFPALLALSACFFWAGNFVMAKYFQADLNPVAMAFWRWVFALVGMFFVARGHIESALVHIKQNKLLIFSISFLGVSVFNTLVYVATEYTTANHVSLIVTTAPVWVIIASMIFKLEAVNKYKIIGLVFAVLGALSIILQGNILRMFTSQYNYGDVILLGSAVLWAAYTILLKFLPEDLNRLAFLFYIVLFGTIMLFPFYLWEGSVRGYKGFSWSAVLVYFYLGFFATVISWLAWNKSVKAIGALNTSLLYYSLPVFSAIMAFVFLDEKVKTYHLIGFFLIFVGVYIALKSRKNLS